MLTRLRPRSAYDAMAVIASIVLIAGGSAYAAATIGAGDIRDGAVRSRHIQDGAVHKADLGADSVGTGKVIDRSLTRSDIKPAELPRPTGADAPHHFAVDVAPGSSNGEDFVIDGPLRLNATCTRSASGDARLIVFVTSAEPVTATTSADAQGEYGRAGTSAPAGAGLIGLADTGARSSIYWFGGAPVTVFSKTAALDGVLSYGVNTDHTCEASFYGG